MKQLGLESIHGLLRYLHPHTKISFLIPNSGLHIWRRTKQAKLLNASKLKTQAFDCHVVTWVTAFLLLLFPPIPNNASNYLIYSRNMAINKGWALSFKKLNLTNGIFLTMRFFLRFQNVCDSYSYLTSF